MSKRENPTPKSPDEGGGFKNGQTLLIIVIAALLTLAAVSFLRGKMKQGSTKEIPYNQFLQMVDDGSVQAVVIKNGQISIEMKPEAKGYSAKTSLLYRAHGRGR